MKVVSERSIKRDDVLAQIVADAVPAIVSRLTTEGSRRLCRDAVALMERPLLEHVLRLTGGNQIRAARVLGINRNTLRKRCRELAIEPRRLGPVSTAPLSAGQVTVGQVSAAAAAS